MWVWLIAMLYCMKPISVYALCQKHCSHFPDTIYTTPTDWLGAEPTASRMVKLGSKGDIIRTPCWRQQLNYSMLLAHSGDYKHQKQKQWQQEQPPKGLSLCWHGTESRWSQHRKSFDKTTVTGESVNYKTKTKNPTYCAWLHKVRRSVTTGCRRSLNLANAFPVKGHTQLTRALRSCIFTCRILQVDSWWIKR